MSGADRGYHVLVVEDEFAIADDLIREMRTKGLTAVGPVADEAAALAALEAGGVDFAVVDINLDGTVSFRVASALRRRSIPFLFLTGYDSSVVPPEFDGIAVLQKPNGAEAIVAEIGRGRAGRPAANG